MIRYIRKGARVYTYTHHSEPKWCRWCGTGYGIAQSRPPYECAHTTCLACGSGQCMGNGLGRGQCGICLIGLLPGWSGTNRQCGYKGCPEKAIAACDRVGFCCRKHTTRATNGRLYESKKPITVAEYIAARLADREREYVSVNDKLDPRYVNAGSWLETRSNAQARVTIEPKDSTESEEEAIADAREGVES